MLNNTQRSILDALIEQMIEDIQTSLSPDLALRAINAVAEEEGAFAAHQEDFDDDILPTIKYFREIYHHEYPQNRAVGDPNVRQNQPGFILYQPNGHGRGVVAERQGKLGLTAYNDNTVAPVTREDVIGYLDQQFQVCRQRIQQAPQPVVPSAPPPSSPLVEPSAPPRPRPTVEAITLFTGAVVDFVDALKAYLRTRPGYDIQAANTFVSAVLHAIRRLNWGALCQNPEDHGIPNDADLLDFIVSYVNEHPFLKPSYLLHANSRQVEHHVLAAAPEASVAASLGLLGGANLMSFYQPAGASTSIIENVTEQKLVQAVLEVFDALEAVAPSFPELDASAISVFMSSWLRSIRKDELVQFNADPENYAGVPKALLTFFQQQLADLPELMAARRHANFCHQQIEKFFRTNNIDAIRQLLPASAAVAAI